MTVYYLSPGTPQTQSGGTRKLYDHVAILSDNGFDARIIYQSDIAFIKWTKSDVVVVPEVYGIGIDEVIPRGVRRVGFAQNPFLITRWGVPDPVNGHPYADGNTPDLIAVMTESELTSVTVREQCPDISVPIIRTHSSGNGRNGKDAGFFYGEWPRKKWVMSFEYKHESLNAQVFKDLSLPDGWEMKSLTGLTDEEIQVAMRTGAVFAACNINEGMCAPTSEAIISGCVNVCWPGGPTGQSVVGGPMEYLDGRAAIAIQDDVNDLSEWITATAVSIDAHPDQWAIDTREWSDWFQTTYSRQGEIDELIGIFESFGCSREEVAA